MFSMYIYVHRNLYTLYQGISTSTLWKSPPPAPGPPSSRTASWLRTNPPGKLGRVPTNTAKPSEMCHENGWSI